MTIKIIHWLGILACITLIVSCFLPWAYYNDLHEDFTGFYSHGNNYGKPGKFLVIVGGVALLFMLLSRIWAKRLNLFLCALALGYTIKTYILFVSCYNNYCPVKLPGIYLMLFSSIFMLVAAVFPEFKMRAGNSSTA